MGLGEMNNCSCRYVESFHSSVALVNATYSAAWATREKRSTGGWPQLCSCPDGHSCALPPQTQGRQWGVLSRHCLSARKEGWEGCVTQNRSQTRDRHREQRKTDHREVRGCQSYPVLMPVWTKIGVGEIVTLASKLRHRAYCVCSVNCNLLNITSWSVNEGSRYPPLKAVMNTKWLLLNSSYFKSAKRDLKWLGSLRCWQSVADKAHPWLWTRGYLSTNAPELIHRGPYEFHLHVPLCGRKAGSVSAYSYAYSGWETIFLLSLPFV